MSSLRTMAVLLLLGGIAYGTYVSLTKNPKSPQSELSPAWPGGPQENLVSASTPQFSNPTSTPGGMSNLPGFSPPSASTAAPSVSINSGPSTASPASSGQPTTSQPPITPFPTSKPAGSSGGSPLGVNPSNNPATAMDPTAAGRGAPTSPASPYPSLGSSGASQPAVVPSPGLSPLPGQAANGPTTSPSNPPYGSAIPPLSPPAGNPAALSPAAGNPAAGSPAANSGLAPTAPAAARQDDFAAFMQTIQSKLDQGQLADAHFGLSKLYNNPRLTPDEDRRLTELLDQIAGTVVYSRQHLLEPPYRVQPGDTLERIGQVYSVPGELLAKINGIVDPRSLQPGMELKVVRGPFDALVDLSRHEMTIFVQGRYAGRFAIGVGSEHPSLEGQFLVRDKRLRPAVAPNSVPPSAAAPATEPYIDLGNQVGIHMADGPQNIGKTGGRGTIGMSPRDVNDVYDILSVGSRVTIRR